MLLAIIPKASDLHHVSAKSDSVEFNAQVFSFRIPLKPRIQVSLLAVTGFSSVEQYMSEVRLSVLEP
jgi:hypothetical protein